MNSLKPKEKAKLEKMLGMSGGYVSNFSDASFGQFFAELGIDIHTDKYSENGNSKAKKLRQFWHLEDDLVVGEALVALSNHAMDREIRRTNDAFGPSIGAEIDTSLFEECSNIGKRLMSGNINLSNIKLNAEVFNASHLKEQIARIEASIENDPSLAIGTAKELIETTCKTILSERGKPVKGTPDISNLTKDTLKELKLIPEGVPDETRGRDVVKRLLQNLGAIGNGLAELRGLYGTGHGKDGKTKGLNRRHAKLAVGTATTLATFLFDTHTETK